MVIIKIVNDLLNSHQKEEVYRRFVYAANQETHAAG